MNAVEKINPILVCLLKVQRKYKKEYSWPSQEKIIELMDLRQGYKKTRATLNRWLRVMEDGKYIKRTRRIKQDPTHGLIIKSTLYKITIKGYRLLSMFGVDMSKEIAQYEKWLDEIKPERNAIKTKKILEDVKRNPRHEEFMTGIVGKLKKLAVNPQ